MKSAAHFLREAAATIDLRAAQRDMPSERSMKRTVEAFNALVGQTLTETQGWLFMVLLKLSRAQAGSFHLDDWLDAAAYTALALECENALQGPLAAPMPPGNTQVAGQPVEGLESPHRRPQGHSGIL